MVAICDLKHLRNMSCEGSRLQNGGLTILLISLPADSDDRLGDGKDSECCWTGQGVNYSLYETK